MARFFVSAGEIREKEIVLTGENAEHAKVLRLRHGEVATVCDGAGREWYCTVEEMLPGQVRLRVDGHGASRAEADVFCSVYMAYAKADKLEHVIQKATELGAGEIVTFPSERCVARVDARTLEKKMERWEKIARSAAEQSGRGRVPKIVAMPSFRAAAERAAACDVALFAYENERTVSLRAAMDGKTIRTVSIMTGPEGGFSEEEARMAVECGMQSCSLGPRILRCETAPLCALSVVMYACGAMERS